MSVATGPCRSCGVVFPLTVANFYRNKTWKTGFNSRCRTCENAYQRDRARTWYHAKHRSICKTYKSRLRKELHDALGNACACCGEKTPEFLELDHIKGGGRRHRQSEKKDLYRVVKLAGYPKDLYRLLCSNCNHALGMRGYCPHQK